MPRVKSRPTVKADWFPRIVTGRRSPPFPGARPKKMSCSTNRQATMKKRLQRSVSIRGPALSLQLKTGQLPEWAPGSRAARKENPQDVSPRPARPGPSPNRKNRVLPAGGRRSAPVEARLKLPVKKQAVLQGNRPKKKKGKTRGKLTFAAQDQPLMIAGQPPAVITSRGHGQAPTGRNPDITAVLPMKYSPLGPPLPAAALLPEKKPNQVRARR